MRTSVSMIILSSMFASAASAHDMWLLPSTFQGRVGDRLDVELVIGHDGETEFRGRDEARIVQFQVTGPDQASPMLGRNLQRPAGMTRLLQPGTTLISYVSTNTALELESDRFEAYLAEEGLEGIAGERARRGESGTPGRESYSRSLKSMLTVTPGGASFEPGNAFDRVLGLPLELVPLVDPRTAPHGQPITFQLLSNGSPVEGVRIDAAHLGPDVDEGHVHAGAPGGESQDSHVHAHDHPGQHDHDHDEDAHDHGHPLTARTDREGKISFVLPEDGVWVLTGVRMRRADGSQPDSDWISTWTSLTFERAHSH